MVRKETKFDFQATRLKVKIRSAIGLFIQYRECFVFQTLYLGVRNNGAY